MHRLRLDRAGRPARRRSGLGDLSAERPTPAGAAEGWPAVHLTWLATLVMGAGPLVGYAMSALGPLLTAELSLSAAEFGAIWLVIFGTAGLASIPGGRFADALGLRVSLVVPLLLVVAALLVGGLAQGYAVLLVAAVLGGLAQAIAAPATNILVVTRIVPRLRSMALGLKQSGVQMSQVVAGLTLPPLALLLGWRYALCALAVLVALGTVASLPLLPGLGATRSRTPAARGPVEPTVRWLVAYTFLTGVVLQATNVHLPIYATRELAMSESLAGLIVAVLGGLGVFARIAWAGVLPRVRELRVPLLWAAGVTAGSPLLFLAADQGAGWLVWVGAGLFSTSTLAANVIVFVALAREVPVAGLGRASGYVSTGMFSGFMLGPVLFGLTVDASDYGSGWLLLSATGAALLLVCLSWRRGEQRVG